MGSKPTRLRGEFILAMLASGLMLTLAVGCGGPVPEPVVQERPVPLDAPAAHDDSSALTAEIADADALPRLYELHRAYLDAGTPSDAVETAFRAKWASVAQRHDRHALVEGLDLIAVDVEATSTREYTFTILLQPTADLAEDYRLAIVGRLDPSHQHLANPDRPYISWILRFRGAPTSAWLPGEFHIAQLKAEIAHIVPINLSVSLEAVDERGRRLDARGKPAEFGWVAGLPE